MSREIETWPSDCIGSVTIVWLTIETDDQAPLHCVIVLTDVMSDHIGRGQRQNHIVGTCRLTQFEGGLNLLHEADDGAVV